MSSSSASSSRTCPSCGARNSGISLFCAECGAHITDAEDTTEPVERDFHAAPSDQTQAFRPIGSYAEPSPWSREASENTDQTTAAYEPVPSHDSGVYRVPDYAADASPAWSAATQSDTYRGEPTQQAVFAPATGDSGQWPAYQPVYDMSPPAQRGIRGFFLGLLAFVLIGIVFAAYAWQTILSASMRETVLGWF